MRGEVLVIVLIDPRGIGIRGVLTARDGEGIPFTPLWQERLLLPMQQDVSNVASR